MTTATGNRLQTAAAIITIQLLLLTGCAAGSALSALRPAPCASDDALRDFAATRRFSAGSPRSVKLAPDGRRAYFLRSGPRDFVQNLYFVDTETGRERRLFTVAEILGSAEENLSPEEKARRERMRVTARGIVSYHLAKDGRRMLVPLSGRLFVIDLESSNVTELQSSRGFPIDPKFSPNGRYIACVRKGEVFVTELESGREWQVSSGLTAEGLTRGDAEFVAQEEMGRRSGYWWSPDSSMIAYQQTDTSDVEKMYIADASRPEKEPQSWPYPRPGKKNADVTLAVTKIAGGSPTWVNWERKRYPYLATVKWSKKAPLTILVQNRQQTEEALLSVDPQSGKTTTLLLERDDAWLNLDQKMPHWMPDGSAFLWTTERNGTWQLEIRNRDGSHRSFVTPVEFSFQEFLALEPGTDAPRNAYVRGSNLPTEAHVYRVGLYDHDAEQLTRQPGLHRYYFSRNGQAHVHSASLANGRREVTIRNKKGNQVCRIRSKAEKPPFTPNLEITTVGDNPEFYASLVRPRNFVTGARYPVIVYVYGGPHSQVVQNDPMRYFRQQWFADHGFVVVSFDGRGTPGRGREWERAIRYNLIDLPLRDQVEALNVLAKNHPELDLGKVGIYGWSFGGYFSAMAAMREPDVYHAAVAGAPVTDWLDYDTHYTERYMGLPDENPDGYHDASVLTYADQLERPLLLIHGTADDNVYFKHSLNLSNSLFRKGKWHELVALSDFTHMVADPEMNVQLYSRIVEFFQGHLH